MKLVLGVDEIIKVYELNNILLNKILFVINDLIGKEFFDEIVFVFWKKYDLYLWVCLKKIKILLLCRKGV